MPVASFFAGLPETFRLVTFPQFRSSFIAGALLAFALSFDDFYVTIFTAPPGVDTLHRSARGGHFATVDSQRDGAAEPGQRCERGCNSGDFALADSRLFLATFGREDDQR